jgi:hypothetical protein
MFNLQPVGNCMIEVCQTGPCWLNGSDEILAHFEKRLGIKPGETTTDGRFSLKAVECLAACGNAPVIQVGTEYHENILLYHGGLNQAERTAVLRRSKETTERTVLLLQLQAGGVGLNLQEYDRIVFMSPWWTAALMDQAIARAVRMGQTQVVKVFHLRLAAEHSAAINIDKLVNAKAEEKRKMLKQLFQLCRDF